MTDSSQGSGQGGSPPPNPYGGQGPAGEKPYSQPSTGEQPPTNPYGQPPTNPYGQPPTGNPYGQPPSPVQQPPQPQQPDGQPHGQPHGQPDAPHPYGQPPAQQQPYGHYASPYGHQQPPAGPLGDGLDMYGRPMTRRVTDGRPGTVTAAGWITLVLSGLTALLYGFITLAMIVAKDEVLSEIDQALAEQGATGDFDAESAFGIVVAVMLVLTIWCVIACVLAVFTMRRSKVSRILLVISAIVAALLSLLAISSGISAVWLLACVLVVILLFTGGANEWFRDRY